jgi:hypothetical protein
MTFHRTALAGEPLLTIAEAIGTMAADVEIQKIEALGPLAEAVFSRICTIGGNVKGSFTGPTLREFSAQLGREVTSGDVQGVIHLMTSANLLMRVGHGVYGVTDSFVEQAWVTRLQAEDILRTNTP